MNFAVFTGEPRFAAPQRTDEPPVEEETKRRFLAHIGDALALRPPSGEGPLAARLEEEMAERHGVAHVVAAANATLAQLLLLKAMGLESGEALVAANAPVSVAHACSWQGLKPVFCDVGPAGLNLDPAEAERKLTDNTVAIIPSHAFGVFADMAALGGLCRRNRLLLLADASHAFDCDAAGVRAGGHGAPEILSLHAREFLGAVEGGAVATNDAGLARELRRLRNLGFDRSGHSGRVGLDAALPELHAAFGLAALPALDQRRERLHAVRGIYLDALSGLPGLAIHPLDAAGRNTHHYFALRLDAAFGVPRDAVREILRRENILARAFSPPGCHLLPPYRERGEDALPRVENELAGLLCLPTGFAGIDAMDAARSVAEVLRGIHDHAPALAAWWEKEREAGRAGMGHSGFQSQSQKG